MIMLEDINIDSHIDKISNSLIKNIEQCTNMCWLILVMGKTLELLNIRTFDLYL